MKFHEWGKRLLLVLLLCLPAAGQITITASRQAAEIPRAYLGAPIPSGMALYSAAVCNERPQEATVFLDRVAAEVALVAPVQDGAAVIYAARAHKAGAWKVTAYRVAGLAAMAAGGFASAGATTVLGQVAGGVGGAAGVSTLLKARGEDLSRLDVPANFWTPDPTREARLQPGQCTSLLFVLAGAAMDKFRLEIQQAPPVQAVTGLLIAPDSAANLEPPPPIRTMPMLPETAAGKLAAMRAADIEFWERVLGAGQ